MPPPHVLCAGLATMPLATPPRVISVRRASSTTTSPQTILPPPALRVPTAAWASSRPRAPPDAHTAQRGTSTTIVTQQHRAMATAANAKPARTRRLAQRAARCAKLGGTTTTGIRPRSASCVRLGSTQARAKLHVRCARTARRTSTRIHRHPVTGAAQATTPAQSPPAVMRAT